MKKTRIFLIDTVIILSGSAIYGMGIHIFAAPNGIAPGGVAGIATVISYLTGIQIGSLYSLINIPLLVLAFFYLKRDFVIKTIASILFFTFVMNWVYQWIPPYQGDRILASIFGGLLMGAGLALAFMRDGSTGGTDITNRIIQMKMPHIKLGKIVFAVDLVVIIFAMIGFRSLESGLYSILTIAVSTTVMDKILYGFNKGKVLMIVTDEPESITRQIMEDLKRGCTLLDATGAYTGEKKNVIICAVHDNEFYKIRRIVYGIDPSAFMMMTDAGDVFGKGFKNNTDNTFHKTDG